MANPVVTYILKLTDQSSDTLKKTGEEAGQTGKEVDSLGKTSKMAGVAMAAMAAAALAAAMAYVKLAADVADARNQLTDLSTRTGIATGTLKAVALAAEGAGLSLQEMEGVFKKVPQALADAQKGSTRAAKSLALLGLGLDEVAAMDPETLFRSMVDGLAAIEDPGQRAVAATANLGAEGTKLLQVLGDPKNLNAFIDATERWGVDVAPEATAQAARYQRELANLNLALDTLKEATLQSVGGMAGLTASMQVLGAMVVWVAGAATGLADLLARMANNATQTFVLLGALITGDYDKAAEAVESVKNNMTSMSDLQTIWDDASEKSQQFTDDMVRLADILDGRVAPSMEGLTTPTDTLKTSLKEVSKAVQDLSDEEILLQVLGPGGADFLGAGQEAKAALEARKGEINSLRARFTSWVSEAEADRASLQAEIQGLAAQSRAASMTNLQGGIEAAGAGLAGDVLGAASNIPIPWLKAVVAALQALQTIGEQGIEAINAQFQSLSTALTEGVKALPAIIGEVIPDFIESIATEFIPALAESIPGMITAGLKSTADIPKILIAAAPEVTKAIIKAIWSLPGEIRAVLWDIVTSLWNDLKSVGGWLKRVFIEVIPDFLRGLASSLSQWWSGVWAKIKGLFDFNIFGGDDAPSFDRGGRVSQTGLAIVHQGERIRQPGGTFSQSGRTSLERGGGAGGGGVTINTVALDPSVLPALVAQLEQVYGSFGTSTSPLFTPG